MRGGGSLVAIMGVVGVGETACDDVQLAQNTALSRTFVKKVVILLVS
jgi:hypothetical protein